MSTAYVLYARRPWKTVAVALGSADPALDSVATQRAQGRSQRNITGAPTSAAHYTKSKWLGVAGEGRAVEEAERPEDERQGWYIEVAYRKEVVLLQQGLQLSWM
ncbi:hypothetical protein NDU88_002166 [Pleurodeles waltl]|uniref:Uncharacterized protein n=1 Tax=Pleurodeles waltl TaxID=8319 RepID=A0AAV7T2L5_PLEWA|nr:hypothetical protein NDU88_002166 [Pleurodeles waltl]